MALLLYRRILRSARRFDRETQAAICAEAGALFRQNRSLTDPDLIEAKLFEGSSRYSRGPGQPNERHAPVFDEFDPAPPL